MAILAVILVHVAFRMIELHHFRLLRQVTRIELAVAVVTFLMTVFVDLNMGVAFGLGVSAVVMVVRLRDITVMRVLPLEQAGLSWLPSNLNAREVALLRIEGVFFYAVADDLPLKVERELAGRPELRVLVLEVSKMLAVDYHGIEVLEDLRRGLRKRGVHLILCGVQPHPGQMMHRLGFLDDLGLDNLCGDLESSLRRASRILEVPRGELFKG
jgi:SulP family sulfate permease